MKRKVQSQEITRFIIMFYRGGCGNINWIYGK